MRHTRREVIQRAVREFKLLDKLVSGLTKADWDQRLARPETKDPWTVKDALAHITHWKADVIRQIHGQRIPPEERGLNMTDGNRLIYLRWHKRTPRQVLAWHRRVQADLLTALRTAPDEWFSGKPRGADWPFDITGHSEHHRTKDIQQALEKRKSRTR